MLKIYFCILTDFFPNKNSISAGKISGDSMQAVLFCFSQCRLSYSAFFNAGCPILLLSIQAVLFCFSQCRLSYSAFLNAGCPTLLLSMQAVLFCFTQCRLSCSASLNAGCPVLLLSMQAVLFCFYLIASRSHFDYTHWAHLKDCGIMHAGKILHQLSR